MPHLPPVGRLALAALVVFAAGCRPAPLPERGAMRPASTAAPTPSVTADSLVIADSTALFFVHVRYPVLHDAGPHTDALNRRFAEAARAYAEDLRPEGPPPEGTGPDDAYRFTTDLQADFAVYRLDDRLFSAITEQYAYTGGAHGNTDFGPRNVDLRTGRPFDLDDVFRPESAYLDTLSARTRAYLLALFDGDEAAMLASHWKAGWAPESANFSRFAVGPDSLHLFFPPYQLAPYAAGPFAFAIPLRALRPLLADDGPAEALRP